MSQEKHSIIKYKIVVVGDTSVGKTCLINRIVYESYEDCQAPTVGIDFVSKNIYVDNQAIRLSIWDTAGQERFRSLIPSYLRDIHAAILVYDVTNISSYNSLLSWLKDVQSSNQDPSQIAIIIVASKIDLLENNCVRAVAQQSALELAQEHNLMYIEASAKQGTNVNAIFQLITCHLLGLEYNNTVFSNLSQPPPNLKEQPEHTFALQSTKVVDKKKCC